MSNIPNPNLPSDPTPEPNLGNLAQAARGNQLKSARWIMIIVGVLTLILNGVMFALAKESINGEVRKLKQQGMQVDASSINDAVFLQQAVTGGTALLGLVFIFLGIMVYKFPVPCTVLGLTLYILSAVGFAILDPTSIARGIIIKIFIIAGLFKSVKSAFAYQAEQNALPH